MGELTEDDRDDLTALFAGSIRSPEHLAFLATPAVEQIIARHVSAALTAAADEVDALVRIGNTKWSEVGDDDQALFANHPLVRTSVYSPSIADWLRKQATR